MRDAAAAQGGAPPFTGPCQRESPRPGGGSHCRWAALARASRGGGVVSVRGSAGRCGGGGGVRRSSSQCTHVALVARLRVAVPGARSPGAVERALLGKVPLPGGHAAHARVRRDGHSGNVGCLCNERHQGGVHRVDYSLVRADAAVRHERRRCRHEDLGGCVGVRAQGAHQVNEGEVVLRKSAVGHGYVVNVVAADPVGGPTVNSVLGVIGPKPEEKRKERGRRERQRV